MILLRADIIISFDTKLPRLTAKLITVHSDAGDESLVLGLLLKWVNSV